MKNTLLLLGLITLLLTGCASSSALDQAPQPEYTQPTQQPGY